MILKAWQQRGSAHLLYWCWFEYTVSPPGDHGSGVGYFNGISAHAARNWIVRGNFFKNLHNPDSAAYLWNPVVLFWNHSVNTLTEQNTFLNAWTALLPTDCRAPSGDKIQDASQFHQIFTPSVHALATNRARIRPKNPQLGGRRKGRKMDAEGWWGVE